jgi:hypothetical protein
MKHIHQDIKAAVCTKTQVLQVFYAPTYSQRFLSSLTLPSLRAGSLQCMYRVRHANFLFYMNIHIKKEGSLPHSVHFLGSKIIAVATIPTVITAVTLAY